MWDKLEEHWKDILTINYIYQFRFNENMRNDLVRVGINPFENYKFKLKGFCQV